MIIYNEKFSNLMNRQPIYEDENSNIVFETPKALLNWMYKNIKYNHNDSSWKLRSCKDVMRTKKGDCHDQALFTEEQLKKMGYDTKRLFMIEYHGDEIYEAGATHTICYYREDGKYYWIENAWEDQHGIHGPFNSVDGIKEEIARLWDYSGLNDRLFITSIGCVSPGMDLEEYVRACLRDNYYPKNYYSREDIKESFTITESDKTDIEFNSPREFLKWMDNIQYQPFRSYWRLKNKDQLIKTKKGNCIDQTELEASILRKLGYKPKKIFVCEYKDDDPLTDSNIGGSHVFAYYTDNGKLYWFEHAWGQYKGIHGPYTNLNGIKEDIKEKWNWNKGYSNLYFCSYGNLKEGSDLKQVYDDILGERRPKVKPYHIKESTIFNEVDVNGQPAGDDDGGGDTTDFTGEPASVTGNDGGGEDTPPADNTEDTPLADDGGDTEDFTDDGGGSGDDAGTGDDGGDTEDFTDGGGGGDDMGGNGGDTGGDSGSGDDTGGGGGAPGDGSIKADDARGLENEIFSNLTPTQISVKHKELKNNFVTMHKVIDELIERVNEMNVAEYQNAIAFVSEQLSNLKEMIADYLTDVYSTKSYMENAMNYNRFLATLNGIKEILDEINKDTPENTDNNS